MNIPFVYRSRKSSDHFQANQNHETTLSIYQVVKSHIRDNVNVMYECVRYKTLQYPCKNMIFHLFFKGSHKCLRFIISYNSHNIKRSVRDLSEEQHIWPPLIRHVNISDVINLKQFITWKLPYIYVHKTLLAAVLFWWWSSSDWS
jgi:hypothetical protein